MRFLERKGASDVLKFLRRLEVKCNIAPSAIHLASALWFSLLILTRSNGLCCHSRIFSQPFFLYGSWENPKISALKYLTLQLCCPLCSHTPTSCWPEAGGRTKKFVSLRNCWSLICPPDSYKAGGWGVQFYSFDVFVCWLIGFWFWLGLLVCLFVGFFVFFVCVWGGGYSTF